MSSIKQIRKYVLGEELYEYCYQHGRKISSELLQQRLTQLQKRGLFTDCTEADLVNICDFKSKPSQTCERSLAAHVEQQKSSFLLDDYSPELYTDHPYTRTELGNSFIYGQPLQENAKNLKLVPMHEAYIPNREFAKTLEKYLNAFLHSEDGGKLYFGVAEDGIIMGTKVSIESRKQRDQINLYLDRITEQARPSIDPQYYTIHFYPVFYQTAYDVFYQTKDKFVVCIDVKPDNTLHETSDIYSEDRVAYTIKDGAVVVMTPSMIVARDKKIEEAQMQKIVSDVLFRLRNEKQMSPTSPKAPVSPKAPISKRKRPRPLSPQIIPPHSSPHAKRKPPMEMEVFYKHPELTAALYPRYVPTSWKKVEEIPRYYEPSDEELDSDEFRERIQLNGWWYEIPATWRPEHEN